jgi:hypothetical protein
VKGTIMSKQESNNPAPDEAGLVKKPVVARAASTSVRTIDNLVKQRKIPIVRISKRCVRFHLPSVLSALRRLEVKEVS